MTERDEQILKLTKQGMSARKVKQRLGLEISVRSIQLVASRYLGKTRRTQSSTYHAIRQLRPYIEECFRRLGKDPFLCEICLEYQAKRCEIHHTKYDGATIYDLQYVCRSCNLARMNQGLN